MERKVTVMSNKGNNTVVINTSATTLGELKTELSAKGVVFDDMAIFEGVSRTELIDNASILPSNLPYKGVVTNDLVILLSPKNKKITSGASAREVAYAAVKENNLQDAVKEKFGKNFTQVSTVDLVEFVAFKTAVKEVKPVDNKQAKTADKSEKVVTKSTEELSPMEALMVGFSVLVTSLFEEGIISEEVVENINAAYGGRFAMAVVTTEDAEEKVEEVASPYSKTEMNGMFDFVGRK